MATRNPRHCEMKARILQALKEPCMLAGDDFGIASHQGEVCQ